MLDLRPWNTREPLELRTLLGLPERGRGAGEVAAAHAAVAPSAPDELSGRWWKHDVVLRLLEEQPGRLIIWVDDELHRDTEFRRWADGQPDVVGVGPDRIAGLSPDDLERIETKLRGN
ncbi:MAG: hypothetical protein ACLGIG_04125 [Actinomycetes bacterium]